MKQTQDTIHKIIRVLVPVCFSLVILFVILGIFNCTDKDFFKGQGQPYTGTWYWEKEDGSIQEFTFPTSLKTPAGEVVRFYTYLPDTLENGMYMVIQSGRNCKAYIDDDLIFTFTHDEWFPGDIVKSIYLPIKLPDNSAGKKLVIVRDEPDVPNGSMNEAYLGDLFTTFRCAFQTQSLLFILGFLLAFIALITIVIFGTLSKTHSRSFPIIFLAQGILACTAWMIMDSKIFQFVFHSYYFDGVTAYMLILLIPMPFCHYLDLVQEKRYRLVYDIMQIILLVSFTFFSILHFTGVASFEKMLAPIDVIEALIIATVFFLVIYDISHVTPCLYKPVATGLGTLMIMSIIEIICINFKINKIIHMDGIFVLLGLYVLLCGSVIDQIKHLQAIEMETQAALAANKAKTTFLANMSHEIRTPINAIMGLNELIIRETDDPAVRGYASDVSAASNNLLDLINDILDFSKIESGKIEIINEEYNIGELADSIATMLEFKAMAKGLDLLTTVSPTLPSVLRGDAKHLREIIINILNNAVKYTPKGHIKFSVEGYPTEGDMLMLKITIEDTGVGIKKEDMKNLFKEFERFDLTKNRNIEGTGLGLAITDKLIKLMNGTITVSSEYGVGSAFTIELPQTIVSYEELGDFRKTTQQLPVPNMVSDDQLSFVSPETSILIVDDNKMNLTVAKGLLKDTQAKVTTASSGQQMLALITKFHYDIIFLDHMMPIMDGVEALHQAMKLENNLCKDTPFIVLTANAIVGAKEEYIKEGFADYLSKPVQSNDLINMLIKYLQ